MVKRDVITFSRGTACNFSGKNAKGEFTLHGDPNVKIERPHTIVNFPGGSVEITRTPDGDHWAHIALDRAEDGDVPGEVVDARVDLAPGCGYLPEPVAEFFGKVGFQHVALKIRRKGS